MQLNKIIQGCKRHERASQSALYNLSCDDMMNISLRYMGNPDDAKDVLQDVYLKVFHRIESYDASLGSLGAWMARITVNECLQNLRKRKRLSILKLIKPETETETDEDVISDLSANEIFAEIQNLPAGYRVIFNLYIIEGYSHKEIGKMLDITASSSRSQLTRAKQMLKKKISYNSNHCVYEKAK